jgi:hypothetical protein
MMAATTTWLTDNTTFVAVLASLLLCVATALPFGGSGRADR